MPPALCDQPCLVARHCLYSGPNQRCGRGDVSALRPLLPTHKEGEDMTTRRGFVKGAAATAASGMVFCGCAWLGTAQAQQPAGQKLPGAVNGKMSDFYPMLRSTDGGEDGDGDDRLQGVPCGGVLTTWILNNSKKSQDLLNRSGVGHGVILRIQIGAQRACYDREYTIIHRQHTNELMRLP